MDRYTDSAFRQICKQVNSEILTYTEFVSADGLKYNSEKLKKQLAFKEAEKPILAQIFGKNPESFVIATKMCEDMGFTGIDLNMGCPAKKVIKSEHGFALRRKPDLAYELIESVAKATSLPVSVKTRLGHSNADDLISFCKGAQNAGADMIAVHARTFKEPYKVPAHWEPLYELKKEIDIPVLGNGGLTSVEDGMEKLRNLDGFLIGQASIGNPWVFQKKETKLSFQEKLPLIKDHAKWLVENKGEHVGCNEIRKHLLRYIKGINEAKSYRIKLATVTSFEETIKILDCISDI